MYFGVCDLGAGLFVSWVLVCFILGFWNVGGSMLFSCYTWFLWLLLLWDCSIAYAF